MIPTSFVPRDAPLDEIRGQLTNVDDADEGDQTVRTLTGFAPVTSDRHVGHMSSNSHLWLMHFLVL